MEAKEIADNFGISYIVLYEDSPNYIVFTNANAIKLIEKLREECLPVRFMEVSKEDGKGGFKFSCCWDCPLESKETMRMYVKRSCDEAVKYINKISIVNDKCLYEIFVFDFEYEA